MADRNHCLQNNKKGCFKAAFFMTDDRIKRDVILYKCLIFKNKQKSGLKKFPGIVTALYFD